MTQTMRPWTLETLGLGSVLDLIKRGAPPVTTGDLVDRIFGKGPRRGALVALPEPSPAAPELPSEEDGVRVISRPPFPRAPDLFPPCSELDP